MRRAFPMILITIAATLLYLALAIAGFGGFGAFTSQPALIAVALITLALAIAAFFTAGNLSAGISEDRGNRWVIAAFGVLGLLAGFLPAYADRRDFWTYDGETLRWIGVALFAAGGALRIYPVFVLGRRFSGLVAIQEGHTLVTTGIYSVIRHPSYLGLLINALGWALAFRGGVGVLLVVLLLLPLLARIEAEERLLRRQFGDAYDAYCRRTARLLPGVY
jgi:protein-S-isoprenylcysteine O-methyltransferase Ste14